MKTLLVTLSLTLFSFALHAQGLNIQETKAVQEGMTTIELFKVKKAERKAKRNHKKETRHKLNEKFSLVMIKEEEVA